jgi:dTDP-4-amino-4,6-dideoxygalactose transaminase
MGCRRGQFPVTERLCETILALPANQTLAEDDIRFVCTEIEAVLGRAAS